MKRIVLIVDDEPKNVELVRDLLEVEGYQTIVAGNGREGVAMAADRRPDLILMDIMMPEMDGLEATRRIKQNAGTRHIPIVALTSCAMTGDETRIRRAGCDGYVTKPVDIDGLLKQVADHTRERLPGRKS